MYSVNGIFSSNKLFRMAVEGDTVDVEGPLFDFGGVQPRHFRQVPDTDSIIKNDVRELKINIDPLPQQKREKSSSVITQFPPQLVLLQCYF